MLSKENQPLSLSSLMEEITQSFTAVKVDTNLNTNINNSRQDSQDESGTLSLKQYNVLRKRKESFLEKCTQSYRKMIYGIGYVPSMLIGLKLFFIVHQQDIIMENMVNLQSVPLAIICLEMMLSIFFAMVCFSFFAFYGNLTRIPQWFKKRWLKNKINEEQIFETYKEKLYVIFQNKEFQNNYFAYTRLQVAQMENQIEQTKIHDTSELKKVLGKAMQCQDKLCISFVDGNTQNIHYQILDMEDCFTEWKRLNQSNLPSAKVSAFLKQHEEFMKNSGLNNLLDKLREPDNANHVVKTML